MHLYLNEKKNQLLQNIISLHTQNSDLRVCSVAKPYSDIKSNNFFGEKKKNSKEISISFQSTLGTNRGIFLKADQRIIYFVSLLFPLLSSGDHYHFYRKDLMKFHSFQKTLY